MVSVSLEILVGLLLVVCVSVLVDVIMHTNPNPNPDHVYDPNEEKVKLAYQRDGYLVVKNLFSSADIDAILAEAAEIARGARGEVGGLKGTGGEARALSNEEVYRMYSAIHHPYKVSELVKSYLKHFEIQKYLQYLVGPNVKSMQSMLFFKQTGEPGQAWHQDEHYIPTRDRSLMGVWVALDNATIKNGCLWVRPGSHKDGVLYPTRPHGNEEFDSSYELFGSPSEGGEGRPLELERGDAVMLNGYLHYQTKKSRAGEGEGEGTYSRALVFHYMRASSLLAWDLGGSIALGPDMRDIEMVIGTDPYAYKGIDTSITRPLLREQRSEGGESEEGGRRELGES